MSWPGNGTNGYFQFDIGCTVPNRPRDAVAFGMAGKVNFYAKGDTDGRQVELLLFKRSSCNVTSLTSQWFALSTSWANYSLDISSFGVRPQDLHAVQFLMDSTHDAGGGTVHLDDDANPYRHIRSHLRGIQSYIVCELG